MLKSDFNKVTLQLYWNRTFEWVSSSKFAAYFQNIFKNTSGRQLLHDSQFNYYRINLDLFASSDRNRVLKWNPLKQ